MQDFSNFGVPNLRTKKEKKYPNIGVLTMKPLLKEGGGRIIEFNAKALELLAIDVNDENNRVAFSFVPGTTEIYVANRTGQKTKSDIRVAKKESISDKRYYEFIKNLLGLELNSQEEVELELTAQAGLANGLPVYEVVLKTSTEEEDSTETVENQKEVEDAVIPVEANLVEEAPVVDNAEEAEQTDSAQSEEAPEPEQTVEAPVENEIPTFVPPANNNPFAS